MAASANAGYQDVRWTVTPSVLAIASARCAPAALKPGALWPTVPDGLDRTQYRMSCPNDVDPPGPVRSYRHLRLESRARPVERALQLVAAKPLIGRKSRLLAALSEERSHAALMADHRVRVVTVPARCLCIWQRQEQHDKRVCSTRGRGCWR